MTVRRGCHITVTERFYSEGTVWRLPLPAHTISGDIMMNISNLIKPLALMVGMGCGSAALAAVDAGLPEYERASGVSGNFSRVGSDTPPHLLTPWAEECQRFPPNVNIQ